MKGEDEIGISCTEHSEQIKLLEQKINRLEKLVKSRDEALNEMYELEKSKNEEIKSLKERIKQDGSECTKLKNCIKTLNDEIGILNDKIAELEQQSISNLKQKQNAMSSSPSPQTVENLLTDKESLYKEIANLRLQISQLEEGLVEKSNELSSLSERYQELESEKNEIINNSTKEKNSSDLIIQDNKSKISEYESRIDTLENEFRILKRDCLDLVGIISILYSTSRINNQKNDGNHSIHEDKLIDIETVNDVVSSIKLSEETKLFINSEFKNKDNGDFCDKNYTELLLFSENIINKIVENHIITKEKQDKSEDKCDINTFNSYENGIKYYLNQSFLDPISVSNSLNVEKDLINNQILYEYSYIMKLINILLIEYEKKSTNNMFSLFKIFSDYYYYSIINFDINRVDINLDQYTFIEKILYLVLKSTSESDFEYILTQINDLFISINSTRNEPIKLDIQDQDEVRSEDSNFCGNNCSNNNNNGTSVKNYILPLFKFNFGFGWTITHLLSHSNKIEVIQLLLEQLDLEDKTNVVNKISNSGFIPLTFSVLNNNLLLTEMFLSLGSDTQIQDHRRNTLLHLTSNPELQEVLIRRRTKLMIKNSSGQLPEIVQDEPELTKYTIDEYDQYNDGLSDSTSRNPLKIVNDKSSSIFISGTPKTNRSLSCQLLETEDIDNKVILSMWISGDEPNLSCRDDFCVFSTPEFENSYPNSNESSIWSILGFKNNNKTISNIYKGKNGDHAAMEDNYDRLDEMCLTLNEKKKGIWSDIIINYTARGLEKSCFPPPLDCPTNLFRQILVLTSERFALFQYSPLKLLQSSPITEVEEIIVPKNSNVLLILKVDGWDDILIELNRRSEFIREFTTAYRTVTTPPEILLSHVFNETSDELNTFVENKIEKTNSFWFGFMGSNNNNNNNNDHNHHHQSNKKSNNLSPARESAFQNIIAAYGETPSIITEPDNLIGLFNSDNQYSLVLAIINKTSFMLLPHRNTSILISRPTYHFGFLGICINPPLALKNPLLSKNKNISNSPDQREGINENRLWQERFFVLRSDGILTWCHHPNDETPCENIPVRLVRQIRVFNLSTSTENEIIPCFALDFTKNSVPSSLILNSESSETRDKWVEKIHNVRSIISELNDNNQ
ncbi:pleckstrin homology (PH) domain containing protein [Cryptosporidium ryanae]|uniref:pleckstrin homology (PH) domain containing protein n=1 Tax=Cryptosporidium ryanae TaxID=515981 RepID=UPI00351A68BE|nr:pleckstrin homology (PH) domain containing protein [Cryptosporidium ryanae]